MNSIWTAKFNTHRKDFCRYVHVGWMLSRCFSCWSYIILEFMTNNRKKVGSWWNWRLLILFEEVETWRKPYFPKSSLGISNNINNWWVIFIYKISSERSKHDFMWHNTLVGFMANFVSTKIWENLHSKEKSSFFRSWNAKTLHSFWIPLKVQ